MKVIEADALEALVDRMAGLRALVVGDLLLDEYRSGAVERVSPEAPVPILRVERSEMALGGAGNVARNLTRLGARCLLGGVLGPDAEGRQVRALVEAASIEPAGLVEDPSRPTTHKLRAVARGQQMLRLDRETQAAIGEGAARRLVGLVSERVADCDVLVLVDYAKGVFAGLEARALIARAAQAGRPVVADPKHSLARFRGASLVKPNLAEALAFVSGAAGTVFSDGAGTAVPGGADRAVSGDASSAAARRGLCEKLRDALGGGQVVVTRGREGMSALDREGRFVDVPTRPLEVYDVQGAGDTALAVLALACAAGASLAEACIVANAASAVVVEKIGTAAVEPEALRARLPEALDAFRASRGEA